MKKTILFTLLFIFISIVGYSQHVKDMNGSYRITNGLRVNDTISLSLGEYINEFSTDTSLSDSSTHALVTESAIKNYVDNSMTSVMDTLTWLDPIISISPYTTCASGDSSDRYIADTTSNGWTKNNIYECDGSSWNEYVPVSGDAVTVIDSSNIFVYNGSNWVTVTSDVTTHWAMNGTDIFNTNSGNVGIGTGGIVNHKLEVYGDIGLLDNNPIEWSGTDYNILLGQESGKNLTSGTNNIFQGHMSGYNNLSGSNNIFQGRSAGLSNTTGNNNIFQGYVAGEHNTTGYGNVFLGAYAGINNTTGYDNIFQGFQTGYNNTTGNYNMFMGYHAGYNNSIGNNNIFQGGSAGANNTTGNNNIFQGYITGEHNTTGNYNVYIGYAAGLYDTLGSNNIFIGKNAGYNETGSNKLYISNSSTTTPLIYGEFDNNYLNINGHLNATDSLGINSEYVSGFTYLDSITSNIANVVTGVPNAYLDTISASYLILNNDSISYKKGVAKFHRIDSLNTSSANIWITIKMDTMVGNETTYGFKFNADSSAIICTQAGIIQVGGCVHYHFYGGSTTLAKLYTRVLIDGQEARCLQTNTNKNRFANATGYQNYIGSVTANKGSTIQLQIQVDNTDLDLQGAAVFDHPVAATIWFNYLSK